MNHDQEITIKIGNSTITRSYPINHTIWKLEEEKRIRRVMADTQYDLMLHADKKATEQVVIRG